MSKVIAFTNVTLDGVMQAPGRPEEDRRGGFEHGGWAVPYAAMQYAGGRLGGSGALLFGRRTYADFYDFWPRQQDNPFTAMLENMPKYVASTTMREPLPWKNSTLLRGDASDAVARLKGELSDDVIIIFGSGVLIQSLMKRNIIDEYLLLIHPLVLGTGRRLFTDCGAFAKLRLIDTSATPTGVVIATYHPAEPTEPPT